MQSNVWYDITYQVLNYNGATVQLIVFSPAIAILLSDQNINLFVWLHDIKSSLNFAKFSHNHAIIGFMT